MGCLVCESTLVVTLPFPRESLILYFPIICFFFGLLRSKVAEFLGLGPTQVSSIFPALLAGFLQGFVFWPPNQWMYSLMYFSQFLF